MSSTLFLFVYILIIILVVIKVWKKSQVTMVRPEEKDRNQPPKSPQPQQNPAQPPVRNTQPKGREWNLSQTMAARRELEEKKSEMYSEADKSLIEKGKEQSTTDYLKQKAAMDELGHRQEESQQRMRQEKYDRGNGLVTAERLIEGDSVPRDRKVLKCGYCGAENLVPVNMRSRYACYFCREAL